MEQSAGASAIQSNHLDLLHRFVATLRFPFDRDFPSSDFSAKRNVRIASALQIDLRRSFHSVSNSVVVSDPSGRSVEQRAVRTSSTSVRQSFVTVGRRVYSNTSRTFVQSVEHRAARERNEQCQCLGFGRCQIANLISSLTILLSSCLTVIL